MALNPDVDLNEQDPEKLFGVEHNDAVNFFVRGNGSGCTGTALTTSHPERFISRISRSASSVQILSAPCTSIKSVGMKNSRMLFISEGCCAAAGSAGAGGLTSGTVRILYSFIGCSFRQICLHFEDRATFSRSCLLIYSSE